MKNSIILALIFAGLLFSSCNNAQNKATTKMKDVNEIAKLTEEQYAQEVSDIYLNAYKGMVDLIYNSKKIDADFEKKLDEIFDNGARQMIQYGKALDLKDSEGRLAYIDFAGMKALADVEKLDKKYTEQMEAEFEKRKSEFEDYGSPTLEPIMDAIFSLPTFLDNVRLTEEMPEMAKRFGVE